MGAVGLHQSDFKTRVQRATSYGTSGLFLSHVIGITLAGIIMFEQAWSDLFKLPATPIFDIPVRLLVLYLILVRVGRVGRAKIGLWDLAYAILTISIGVGIFVLPLILDRAVSREDFQGAVLSLFRVWFYFALVRECALREGFHPRIITNWVLAGLAGSAGIGVLQAFNIFGVRDFTFDFYRIRESLLYISGQSKGYQSRGATVHANQLAIESNLGVCIAAGTLFVRRLSIFEWLCGITCFAGCMVSQSRGGALTLCLLGLAYVVFHIWNGKWGKGVFFMVVTLASIALAWQIVYVFDIDRFKRVLEGTTVKLNDPVFANITGRARTSAEAYQIFQRSPVFGIGAGIAYTAQPRYIFKSAYNIRGVLSNQYALAIMSYGVFGAIFIALLLFNLLSHIRKSEAHKRYACVMYLCGCMLLVSGIGENTIFNLRPMIIIAALAALAASRFNVSNPEFVPTENYGLGALPSDRRAGTALPAHGS